MIQVAYTFSQNINLPSCVEKNRLALDRMSQFNCDVQVCCAWRRSAFSWIFIISVGLAKYSNVHTILIVKTGMSQLNVVTKFSRSPIGRDAFTRETGCLCGGTNTDGLTKDIGELTQPPNHTRTNNYTITSLSTITSTISTSTSQTFYFLISVRAEGKLVNRTARSNKNTKAAAQDNLHNTQYQSEPRKKIVRWHPLLRATGRLIGRPNSHSMPWATASEKRYKVRLPYIINQASLRWWLTGAQWPLLII